MTTHEAELERLLEAELLERARESLLAFTCYTFNGKYRVGKVHRVIAEKLEAFERGDIKRMILTVPPRHGKTQLASRQLPAWALGRNPDRQIIATSYAASLADSVSLDAKAIVASDAFARVFPGVTIGDDQKNTASEWGIAGHRGRYIAAGVGGGITGKGGDILIIDDPIKDDIEAQSVTHRERVWNWYTKVFKTRAAKDAGILLIMTRWHLDDLAGRLLEQARRDPEADQWVEVRLPALAEETDRIPEEWRAPGEALWPWFKGVDEWEKNRREDPAGHSAIGQQRPAQAGGTVIKSAWCEQFWEVLPLNGGGQWFWTVDAKAGSKDPSSSRAVIQLWYKPATREAELYLVDQVMGVWDHPETLAQMRRLAHMSPWSRASAKLVEAKADGKAIMATLKSEIPGITPINPQGSKVVRARAIAPYWAAGNIWLPHPSRAPWISEFIHEITTFPASAHDDQLDAMTMAVDHAFVRDQNDPIAHLRRITGG